MFFAPPNLKNLATGLTPINVFPAEMAEKTAIYYFQLTCSLLVKFCYAYDATPKLVLYYSVSQMFSSLGRLSHLFIVCVLPTRIL